MLLYICFDEVGKFGLGPGHSITHKLFAFPNCFNNGLLKNPHSCAFSLRNPQVIPDSLRRLETMADSGKSQAENCARASKCSPKDKFSKKIQYYALTCTSAKISKLCSRSSFFLTVLFCSN